MHSNGRGGLSRSSGGDDNFISNGSGGLFCSKNNGGF